MGASRKLQGEIDRVLKKVQEGVDVFDSIWNKVYDTDNANQKEKFEADLKKEIKKLQRYRDQIKTWIQSSEIKDKKALLDARKLIEKEMERFKVCEKETKTKAFSKEGLGQQPKTDPKEKAKSETRDWLNGVVSDLQEQIDYFEADIEGLSVKKGKTKPPRLAHLEASIIRHKAHITKLEVILRLLDNDELSPEQVNDVKDFIDDYVERNQEDFDEFDDVDELYSSLPLDKVESLEELVAASPGISKATGASSSVPSLSLKTSIVASTSQDQGDEIASQDSSSDTAPRTPPSTRSGNVGMLPSTPTPVVPVPIAGANAALNGTNILQRPLASPATPAVLAGPVSVRSILETSVPVAPSSPVSLATVTKEEEVSNIPSRRASPALTENIGLRGGAAGGAVRGTVSSIVSGHVPPSIPLSSNSTPVPTSGPLGASAVIPDLTKRNLLDTDDRIGNGSAQPLLASLGNKAFLQQPSKIPDASGATESSNADGASVGGRVFTNTGVSGVQWRPPTPTSFQNQNEMFRGRTEISSDQREKYLLRFQQVQQGQNNLIGMSQLAGVNKQFPGQQQSSILQQLNSQSPSLASQAGLVLGLQGQGSPSAAATGQQPSTLQQQSPPHVLLPSAPKESETTMKMEEVQHQKLADDASVDINSILNKNEDDMAGSSSLSEANQLPRDTDFSLGQPLQVPQPSGNLGVIGRRSIADLGAIGDNISGSNQNAGGSYDQIHNLQMLEYALYKLPQPKDSERIRNYVPKHPAVCPAIYPRSPAPIFDNPAFWERASTDTDILFFAFYYQQNTYQQYLAAKELKKQSWRYHKRYNTWFQRHEEPRITSDEYEQGTYVYFDFHIASDEYANQSKGWCQRIKTDFTFEYSYLEDELPS